MGSIWSYGKEVLKFTLILALAMAIINRLPAGIQKYVKA